MAKTDLDMSKASLRLAYDGEALASHRMDVRDLAPALMGLGELLNAANELSCVQYQLHRVSDR